MFGIRAKALFVYLTLSFILNEKGKTTGRTVKIFNCDFIDDHGMHGYKTEKEAPYWESIENEDRRPKVLTLKTKYKWDEFNNSLTAVFLDVMLDCPVNNVDQFIGFIKAYKQVRPQENLESFFKNYHVPYDSCQDSVSHLVEIHKQLLERNLIKQNTMYLVTGYVDPKGIPPLSTSNSNMRVLKIFKQMPQRHVAGMIRINIDGKDGMILLDPGFINGDERVNPFIAVIMSDSTSKYNTGGFETKKYREILTVKGKATNEKEMYYLRNEQFCTFMESTTKGNLLLANHGIITYSRSLSPKGYFTFEVDYKAKKHEYFLSFFLTVQIFHTKMYNLKGTPYDFAEIQPDNIPERRKKFVNNLSFDHLNMKKGQLLAKLRTIQKELFEDNEDPPIQPLLKEINELTIKYHGIDETSREADKKPGFQFWGLFSSCFGH